MKTTDHINEKKLFWHLIYLPHIWHSFVLFSDTWYGKIQMQSSHVAV